MTETERALRLTFLEVLLAANLDELGRLNAAIRAAREIAGDTLPSGAEKVIAAGIANGNIAAKLEQLEQKRREGFFQGFTQYRGTPREQIRATAQRRREEAEARRLEREREQQRRRAEKREAEEARRQEQERQRQQREAEKREAAEARKRARIEARKARERKRSSGSRRKTKVKS